jgi:hypothetical protein
MQGTKTNRERKNGASREEWQKRKAEANAAREPQRFSFAVNQWVRNKVETN